MVLGVQVFLRDGPIHLPTKIKLMNLKIEIDGLQVILRENMIPFSSFWDFCFTVDFSG